jgi:S1-C subfamily serine protease
LGRCFVTIALSMGVVSTPRLATAQTMKPSTEERVKRATVLVFTAASRDQKGDQVLGSGSGYFINGTGLLLTNNHVVDPAHKRSLREKQEFHYQVGRLTWSVVTNAGTEEEKPFEAVVTYQNDAADQAILQAYEGDGTKLRTPHYLRLLPESRLKERMKVWALGFPGGDSQRTSRDKLPAVSLTDGSVTDLPRTPAGRVRMIWTDVLARPGSSGGPMVNVDGFCVGTVTLMGQSEGRANTSMLVPAALSVEFVGNAFALGRIPRGSDVTPFLEILTDDTGRVNIPEYTRLVDRDVLFYGDGDRIYGTIAMERVQWDSPLGAIEVPTEAVAYVMADAQGATLVLEGGNHIRSKDFEGSFRFTPDGGTEIQQRFDEVGVVGFRTGEGYREPISGEVLVFDADTCHLVLEDVKGQARFNSRAGTIEIALDEIDRIDTRLDDDRQVISVSNGQRMSGHFQETRFTARLAATGVPVTFSLDKVTRATIEVLGIAPGGLGGLNLSGVLASADRSVRRAALALEQGEVGAARAKIDGLLDRNAFRKLPTIAKEQVRLLDSVIALRTGDFDAAEKGFRKASKAKDVNIASYALACVAVLKRFGTAYEGRSLSNHAVFVESGIALARELLATTRELIREQETLEGKKGEYARSISAIRREEESMLVAAVFIGAEADDERIRLWKFAREVCLREIDRLDELTGRDRSLDGRSGRPGRSRRGPAPAAPNAMTISQWELNRIEEQREEVVETLEAYVNKLATYGFRIEDPDIHEFQQQEDEP